jgi:hypothetical protein
MTQAFDSHPAETLRMMRASWVPAVLVLAATAAACAPGRPAPPPEQWIVLQEGAEQRASVNALGIRIEPGGIRRATVAVDTRRCRSSRERSTGSATTAS